MAFAVSAIIGKPREFASAPDLPCRRQPIHFRHHDVHQYEIDRSPSGRQGSLFRLMIVHSLRSVPGLRHRRSSASDCNAERSRISIASFTGASDRNLRSLGFKDARDRENAPHVVFDDKYPAPFENAVAMTYRSSIRC